MGRKIVIYTDASYDQDLKVSACGYVILVDFKMHSHNVYLIENMPNVNDAERYAIILALKDIPNLKMFDTVLINTDCLFCINAPNNRITQIITQYKKLINKIKKVGVDITFKHVKSHKNDQFNNLVDRSCRKQLREHRKSAMGTLQKFVPK